MARVVIERFPDDLYRTIKAEAARTGTTAREVMISWLQEKAPREVKVTYEVGEGLTPAKILGKKGGKS